MFRPGGKAEQWSPHDSKSYGYRIVLVRSYLHIRYISVSMHE